MGLKEELTGELKKLSGRIEEINQELKGMLSSPNSLPEIKDMDINEKWSTLNSLIREKVAINKRRNQILLELFKLQNTDNRK